MLSALARRIASRPALVALAWLVLTGAGFAAAIGVVGDGLFSQLSSGAPGVAGEAEEGLELVATAEDPGDTVTLAIRAASPADPALAPMLAAARDELLARDDVASVADPVALAAGPGGGAAAAPLTAADGNGILVTVTTADGLDAADGEAALEAATERLTELGQDVVAELPGASAAASSGPQLVEAITTQVETDLRTGESIALPASLLVMVFVFGGFLAAGMPIAGAIASIAGGLAALLGFATVIELDASVVNIVSVLGLGLCIDYGLLMVSRYREELRARLPAAGATRAGDGAPGGTEGGTEGGNEGGTRDGTARHRAPARAWQLGRRRAGRRRRSQGDRAAEAEALVATMRTAGRTVTFSAITVAISLAGLLAFQADILRATGAAGMSVVLVAWVVALTLVPALMVLAGRRMIARGVISRLPGLRALSARFGDVPPAEGVFSRLARRVQRRPWLVMIGVLAVLLGAAAPVLGIQLRSSGVDLLPVDHPERQFFDGLAADFPASQAAPVEVVADADARDVDAWAVSVAALDGVLSVDPSREVGDYSVLGVRVEGDDPAGPVAIDVVRQIRADRPAFDTWVTGQAAGQVDFSDALRERVPWAVGLVVLATFALLFLMTGSVLIPVKALLMNVVSLGASLGVVVWGFQDGHLEGLLGFTSTGAIETIIPPLVLAFGFGLAMDYEVFLLSRIKEFRDTGLSNDEAVVAGLQKSGRIITSAALVVVLVFSGFVAGEVLVIKQTGVALAVAVAIDATLVRVLLVPATMTLLGEWNWWAPGPLRRLHARLGIRE